MDQDQPYNFDLSERDQGTFKTPKPSRVRCAKEVMGEVLHMNSARKCLSSSSFSTPSCTRSGGYGFGSEKRETPLSKSFASDMTVSLHPHHREDATRQTSSPSAASRIQTDNRRGSSTSSESFLEKNEILQNGRWSKYNNPIRSDCTDSIVGFSFREYPYSSVNSTSCCPSSEKGLLESNSIGQKRSSASIDTAPSLPLKKMSSNLYEKLLSASGDTQYGPTGIPVRKVLSHFSEKPLPSSRRSQSGLKDVSTKKLHSVLSEGPCPDSRGTSFEPINSSENKGPLPMSETLLPNRSTPFGSKDLSTNNGSSTISETPFPLANNAASGFGDVIGTNTSSGPQNLLTNKVSMTLTEKPLLGSRSTPSRPKGSSTSQFFPLDSVKMIPASVTSLKTPTSVTVRRNGQVTTSMEGMRTSASTAARGHQTLDMETEEEDVSITRIRSVYSMNNTALPDELDISNDAEVFMSVMWHGGKLGVAYYDVNMTKICMMLDALENDEFKLLERVLKQVGPSQVILSTKQDERLLKRIKSFYNFSEDNTGIGRLQFLPSIDMSLEMCKRRILSLDLPSIPSHYTDTERTLYISSLVPFENECMVRAVGGLIKYLERKRIGVQLEEQSVRVPILELKIFSLENQLIMDDAAFSALQIFQKEFHPSAYKVGTSSSVKEGLSLFGILNRCKSQNGSKLLKLWFLRPLRDQAVLKQRYDAISFFVNPRNIEVVSSHQDSLKNIKNVSRILMRMTQSQASFGDWQVLYKTAYHAIYVGDLCRAQPQNIEIFRKPFIHYILNFLDPISPTVMTIDMWMHLDKSNSTIPELEVTVLNENPRQTDQISVAFSDRLHRLATFISQVVDFEESSLQRRFVVKPSVDAELDQKKRTYNGLPDFMTQVARKELENLSEDITECNVLYLPQLGYLLAIPKPEGQVLKNYEIEGLTFMFLSNNMLHYKSASTRELDAIFGDIQCDITDMETTIMHKLQNKILEESQILLAVVEYTAELDCLLALAACTREFGYVRPSLTEENVIEITGGRHPLQEVCCSPFVPNDTISNNSYGKIKVLTGPNACGKSVYLKQVALIVYMAHIGSFVPAESAKIGSIDRIFTRIHSLESVSVGLSTFMIDINQMAVALRNASERSLIVVDEFGKGTDMTLESLHNGEDLVFLYQLVEGHTSSSYASHVAAQAGLPKEIVQRGSVVSDMIRKNKPVHRIDSESTDTQYKRCVMIVSKFLEVDLETADLQSFLKNTVLPMSKEKL